MNTHARLIRASLVWLACLIVPFAFGAEKFGKFQGPIQTEWSSDGRSMTLLADFKYYDPLDKEWLAPKGAVVDGASIPRFAWSIIGGPFEGKYRDASVIHDVACEVRSRPWEMVHETFYLGMRCAEVGVVKAKIMYAAVYYFGPRWPEAIEIDTNEADVESVLSRIAAAAPVGSEIYPFVAAPPAGDIAHRPAKENRLRLMLTVVPPRNVLREQDFAALQGEIERSDGDISLEQIRRFGLSRGGARETRVVRQGALQQAKAATEQYYDRK